MPSPAGGIAGLAHQVGLIALDELRECWDELGSQNAPEADLLRVMQRKGYLTPFQIDKLQKGETSGYFFGGHKILYKVASGSFARVYRARSAQTGETIALKVLRQRWTSDKASVDAFYHEGRVGMMLRHPNIVRVDEVAGHESHHYIAMEFVEGGNLRDFMQIRQHLERDECIRLMLDMARGLGHAFEQGVTHRDLKLSNVLISSHGEAKLVDFGLATLHKDERTAEEAHGQRTVEYGILERTTSVDKGDPRSDIFFLGAIYYQMVTGRAAIPEKRDRASRLLRTRIDNIRPVREANPNADPALAAIIDRMMSLSVAARYQTPHEVVTALEGVRAGPAPVRASAAAPRPRGPATIGTAAGRSILFVEADTRLQDTVRERLHAVGYRVLVTADPLRAVDRFKDQPAEAVIVDCESTKQRGLESITQIADYCSRHRLPFAGIVMLGPDQAEWAAKLHQHSNVAVLQKPVTLRQLREAVQERVPTDGQPTSADD
jgi:CheY-like chemotaxis protein/tRNA A-37 threonylcarbamoyl transferase component Bud32